MKMQWLIDIIKELVPGMPTGTIVAWSGNFGNVPDGWHVCDGANGTIDLRRKFIWGAGLGNPLYAIGGTESHIHGGGGVLAAGANRSASAQHVPPYRVLWYIQKL